MYNILGKIDLNKSISVTTYKKHKLFSNENYCGDMDWIVYDNGNTKIKYNDNLTIEIEDDEYSKYYKHCANDRKSSGKVTYSKLKEKIDLEMNLLKIHGYLIHHLNIINL